jgi:ArsR family transcriptional regulator
MVNAVATVARERGVCCELPAVLEPEWALRRADLLKVLADPTRLNMVAALRQAQAPICICDFVAAFDLTQPTISHHAAKLRQAGLVEARREGIWSYYRLRSDLDPPTRELLDAVLS